MSIRLFHIQRTTNVAKTLLLTTLITLPFQNCSNNNFQIDEAVLSSGNSQNDGLHNGDTLAPSVAILSPVMNAVTRGALIISGSCEAGLDVALNINDSTSQTLYCPRGVFTGNITLAANDGPVVLKVSQTDKAGNIGTHQVSIVKDSVAPRVQISSPAQNASLSSQALNISGTCEAGLSVQLSGSLLSAPAQVDCANGSFQAAVSTVSTNGSYTLTATQTDAAGNQGSESRNITLNILLGAPAIRITAPAANSATRTGITISGTCTNNLPVRLSGTGLSQPSEVNCASGAFTAAITFSSGDGTKNIIVSQTNSQNTTGQDSRSFILDTTPPAVAILSPAAGTQAESTLTITGSCETNRPVSISGAGVATPFTTPCNSAMFQASVTLSNNAGTKVVTVSQTDAVGNMGSNSRSFERVMPVLDGRMLYTNNCASCHGSLVASAKLNRTAAQITASISTVPQMSSIQLSAAQIEAIARALETADTTPPSIAILSPVMNAVTRGALTVSGSCETGLSVSLSVNNVAAQTFNCSQGMFSGNVTLTANDGSLILRVSQVDGAGNTGSHQVTVVKDSVAPQVQISSPAQNATLSSQALNISGTCETGLPVQLSGSLLSAPAQVNCTNASFQAAVSTVNVNGNYVLTVTQTDAAGNQGSQSRNITLNILLEAPAIAITAPAANSATRTGITLSGTCTNNLPVRLSGTGLNQASQVNCVSGAFSAPITFSSGDGTKNIIVSQTNAQNTTRQDSRSFILDTTPPSIAILSPAAGTQAETALTISGSCETGRPVSISGAGVATAFTTNCTSAMFQASVTFSNNAGTKVVTVSQTDAVGNMGSNSRSFERIVPVLDGSVLYANNCSACHGDLSNSTKFNRTAAQITSSISTIPQMSAIRLSPAQISAVASALQRTEMFTCNENATLAQKAVQKDIKRHTQRQYINTLRDLLSRGITSTSTVNTLVNNAVNNVSLPSDDASSFSRFDQSVVRQHMKAYFDIADALATTLTNSTYYDSFTRAIINLSAGTCTSPNTASLTSACATRFVANFGLRALRRPLTTAEQTTYLNAYTSAGGNAAGISTLIFKFLMAPQFLYQIENGGTVVSGSLVRLSSYEVASRLSYMFWNSMPDEELLTRAASSNLSTDAPFLSSLTYVADHAKAQDSIREFMNEWLKLNRTPHFATNNQSLNWIANNEGVTLDGALRTAMINEVQDLGAFIYQNNLTFRDLFTSDVSFARDSRLVSIYGVSGAAPANVTVQNAVRFPAGQRGGLLTRAALLVGGTELANPIKRGIRIRKEILCRTLDNPPADLPEALEPPPHNINMTTRERYDLATSPAACMGCHQLINSLGHALGSYNSFGKYMTQEPIFDERGVFANRYLPVSTAVDLSTSIQSGLTAANALELSTRVASQPDTLKCFSEKALQFTEGRVENLNKEGCRLNGLYSRLSQSRSLKDFFRAMAEDPEFRHRLMGAQ